MQFGATISLRIALIAALLVSACGEPSGSPPSTEPPDSEPPPEDASLVDHDLWTVVDAADDPYAERRSDVVSCGSDEYGAEDFSGERAFSVETGDCNYITVEQSSQAEVQGGDTLVLRLWHFNLFSDTAEEAFVALSLDGEEVWQETIGLPQEEGQLYAPEIELGRDVPAGAPVIFHLDNHGTNSWSLIEVSVRRSS